MLGAWAAAAEPDGLRACRSARCETQPQSPPVDTGEALGLPPAQLTITVGFGPSLFDDRFGLASKRPAALADLPALPGDALDPTRSGGDLCVQACSNDPQVAFHVIRNFARIGRGTVVMRWSQLGFGRTSTTSTTQSTPRNLMGFKDGTNNIKSEDAAAMNRFVWVGDETDQPWMRGGSYLVSRRIRMLIESWDADYLADQQNVFGRFKDTGAPLTGKSEFDAVQPGRQDQERRARHPGRRAHPARQPGQPTAARRSCAAATPTPTATTRRPGSSTPACSSLRSRRIRASSSCRSRPRSASTTR